MSDSLEKALPVVLTADGTVTTRDRETGELFHNSGGAYLEAVDNYVLPARIEEIVRHRSTDGGAIVHVLDSCFGLGYNTFALWQHILSLDYLPIDGIEVIAIERDPELVKILPRVLQQECFRPLLVGLKNQYGKSIVDDLQSFLSLGLASTSLVLEYKTGGGTVFRLNIHFQDLRKMVPLMALKHEDLVDLVFHDPFSPAKVPQLWTFDLFSRYRTLLHHDWGRLLTYSAASAVRGGLLEAGFAVYRTRGVGAKSGGTLGASGDYDELLDDLIYPLEREELEKLSTSSGIPYRDPGFVLDRNAILHKREIEQKIFKEALGA